MNVLHLGKFDRPESGGIEKIMFGLMGNCDDFTHEAVCFSRGSSRNVSGKVHGFRCFEMFRQPLSLRYLIIACKLARSADILHVHLPNYLALLIALIFPEKSVLHWHSDVIGKGLFSRILRPLELFVVRKVKHIVFTSEDYARSSYVSPIVKIIGHSSVVPLSLPEDEVEPISIAYRKNYLLFIGRLVDYKNVTFLLDLACCLPLNLSIKIVGDGPLKQSLTSSALVSKCGNKVDFLGRLDDVEKHTLIKNASFLVLPSKNRAEAFGVVLLESLRAGTPIITAVVDGSGLNSVNSDYRIGIRCISFDPVEWAEQIMGAYNSSNFDASYIRSHFLRMYSDRVVFTQWSKIYSDNFGKV